VLLDGRAAIFRQNELENSGWKDSASGKLREKPDSDTAVCAELTSRHADFRA
jgi:hypothetical protein